MNISSNSFPRTISAHVMTLKALWFVYVYIICTMNHNVKRLRKISIIVVINTVSINVARLDFRLDASPVFIVLPVPSNLWFDNLSRLLTAFVCNVVSLSLLLVTFERILWLPPGFDYKSHTFFSNLVSFFLQF